MTETGFPPPDDSKKPLKSRLMNSAAPLPEQTHSNPFAATEAPPPEPSNENGLAHVSAEPDFNAKEPTFDSEAPVSTEEAVRIMTDWNERDVASDDALVDTDVHAENVSRFKTFMRGAVEKFGGAKEAAGKGYEASAEFLSKRIEELGAKAKELGPQAEKIARTLGAEYNKLNWKQKIAIGVGLASVAALGTALTGGGGLLWGLGATGWWRVLSGSGTFVALDGVLNKAKEVKGERWWNKHAKAYAATAGVIVGGASFAIAGGEAIAHSGWLADMLGHGHHAAGAVARAATAHAPITPEQEMYRITWMQMHPHTAYPGDAAAIAEIHKTLDAAPSAGAAHDALHSAAPAAGEHAANAAPAAPELAPVSVEAHAGDGGIKLFKHLQEAIAKTPGFDSQHLTPVQEHIVHGDPAKLAEEYGFYKPNEALESARVLTGSSLGFDAHGDLIFTEHGAVETLAQNHGYEGAFMHAGHSAGAAPEHAQLHEVRARLGLTEHDQTEELNRMSLASHRFIGHEPAQSAAAPGILNAPSAPAESVATHAPAPLEPGHGGTPIEAYPVPPGAETAPPLGNFSSAVEYAKAHLSEAHVYGGSGGKEFFVLGSTPDTQAKAIAQFFADPHHAREVVYGTDASGHYRIPYVLGADGKIMPGLPIRTGGFFGFFSSWMKAPSPADVKTLVQ